MTATPAQWTTADGRNEIFAPRFHPHLHTVGPSVHFTAVHLSDTCTRLIRYVTLTKYGLYGNVVRECSETQAVR